MYQPEIKQRFIDEFTTGPSLKKRIERLFQSFEEKEQAFQSDLTLLPLQDLQSAFSAGTGLRSADAEDMLYVLRAYVQWRIKNNLQTTKSVYSLSTDQLDKIFDQMVGSPLHLKLKLNSVFDSPEDETVDCIYRTYLWLAFIGMDEEDTIHVRVSDVDLNHLCIHFNGRIYDLPRECIPDFSNACTLTSFFYDNEHYQIRRDRAPGDYLLRTIRLQQFNIASARVLISQVLHAHSHDQHGNKIHDGFKLSYHRLYLSGLFYRAYERERAGLLADFDSVVSQEMDKKQEEGGYKLDKNRTIGKIKNQRIRSYEKDYQRWKLAFIV